MVVTIIRLALLCASLYGFMRLVSRHIAPELSIGFTFACIGSAMLLAGVLMDKGQDPETIDTVFSDILNREEAVKLPVLREVIKDTKHPCWKDAAWILDVTKQLPDESPAQPQQ